MGMMLHRHEQAVEKPVVPAAEPVKENAEEQIAQKRPGRKRKALEE